MHALLQYLQAEQPRINAVLDRLLADLNPLVRPVAEHVLAAGGKRLRPLLLLLTARSLGRDDDALYPLACSLEYLHSATLLHDDILDGAVLRRGRPAAHTLFGLAPTILAGDVLLALGNRLMADAGDARLAVCISKSIMATATGEVQEIAQVGNINLTLADYLEIITGKTAWLLQAACQCGAIAAGATPVQEAAAARYGLDLGIAFQLVDDALDYDATREKAGKPVGADLLEGKVTMPLLFYLEQAPAAEKEVLAGLMARLRQGDAPEQLAPLFAPFVQRVAACGGAQKTRDAAREYIRTAAAALDAFPAGREKDMLLEAVAYVVARER
ncbi:polyprenyl synthetase family protein [Megalodesulfovibrio gigas]|uniref:Putative Trans-hexaprenyltranstransferase n=1 Tax=Megalodesulfovibrio gigas (strain ATCC 19364 / DSM 1382 / NCIMB 9332 / VKM B-1759) TaxID=1121448 RepID=T2GAD1_MEGG1|nr:polyprenyl synthetase family protein [Megalodesulfovibrio gigas]AGW13248.1 putative Trans-hexaprenyltranstransferase [Megalodesulfovibrio gigas DSM 1382 = ATCC 19364]